jgi:hypothetical protein
MSLAHKADDKKMVKELSQDDLQVSYAIYINNAIAEDRTGQIPSIVRSFKADKFGNEVTRRSVMDRFRDALAG